MAIFFYIKQSPYVWKLFRKKNSEKVPYNDNMCAFRALAAFQLKRRVSLAEQLYELFELFCSRNQQEADNFEGVGYNNFDKMETFWFAQFFSMRLRMKALWRLYWEILSIEVRAKEIA